MIRDYEMREAKCELCNWFLSIDCIDKKDICENFEPVEPVEEKKMKIELNLKKFCDEQPKKAGDYFVISDGGIIHALYYDPKIGLFNVYEDNQKEFAIGVKYWAEFNPDEEANNLLWQAYVRGENDNEQAE